MTVRVRCKTKVCYATMAQAEEAAVRLLALSARLLYPYQCVVCHAFHLTKRDDERWTRSRRRK